MLECPQSSDLSTSTFSEEDMLHGVPAGREPRAERGLVRVEVDGTPEDLRFYGRQVKASTLAPLVYLGGDCSQRKQGRWCAFDAYLRQSPRGMQLWAEQVACATGRTFLVLARPGVHGSSGNHQQRRRPREVAAVDTVLTALKAVFGWELIDLAGLSGGGHLVAALMARRRDVGCAVLASGNVSLRQRNREFGRDADVTGFADFVDPIDLVGEVARHPPRSVVMLTDPDDTVVSATVQTAYAEALRREGVSVDHRLVPALDPGHHDLSAAALLAASAAPTRLTRQDAA